MSAVIPEMLLRKTKFEKGDLIYYPERRSDPHSSKRYGIVAHVELSESESETKIWAFWQRNTDENSFDRRYKTEKWGSGFMMEDDCYLAPNKYLVKDWKNLPKFFKC